MHEMSLAEGVLQLVEETAMREKAQRVKLVVLEIGCLSSVEPEAMRFCFEAVTSGGSGQGAALEVVVVPGEGWCMACGETVPMAESYAACPRCGGYQLRPTGGTGMRVREIEIE